MAKDKMSLPFFKGQAHLFLIISFFKKKTKHLHLLSPSARAFLLKGWKRDLLLFSYHFYYLL
jgi:hypothetical protein